MSNKIDIDVAELERFVGKLVEFNRKLEENTYQINGQFQELGQSWRDPEYQKFSENWMGTFNSINRYLDDCMGYVQHLRIKAAKLRDAQS